MVLLIPRLTHSLKLFSKLEETTHNHHHHHNDLSSSLQTFQSNLSNCFNQMQFNSTPTSDLLSLTHVQHCFNLLRSINRAFAKLVTEIDYPIKSWEACSVDEYLNYSLDLLDLLNSISSLISQLGRSRVSISHGLGLIGKSPLVGVEHLKPMHPKCSRKGLREEKGGNVEGKENLGGKLAVFRHALMEMRRIGLWVCGITLSGLCGDADHPFLEVGKSEGVLLGGVWESKIENGVLVKEVKEVNDAVERVVGAIMGGEELKEGGKELERRLEILGRNLEGVEKESNALFSEVLAVRNEVLDSFRRRKN